MISTCLGRSGLLECIFFSLSINKNINYKAWWSHLSLLIFFMLMMCFDLIFKLPFSFSIFFLPFQKCPLRPIESNRAILCFSKPEKFHPILQSLSVFILQNCPYGLFASHNSIAEPWETLGLNIFGQTCGCSTIIKEYIYKICKFLLGSSISSFQIFTRKLPLAWPFPIRTTSLYCHSFTATPLLPCITW